MSDERKVEEARPVYLLERRGTTRLSGKNQITLPVAMTRQLGLKPGDAIELAVTEGAIEVRKRLEGAQLLDSLQGAMAHVPEWKDAASIDAYIRAERDSWDERERSRDED